MKNYKPFEIVLIYSFAAVAFFMLIAAASQILNILNF